MLKKSLKTIRVNSVDAFQGQECEVVIMSLVRNNSDGIVFFMCFGFVSKTNPKFIFSKKSKSRFQYI